jgi:hypothetical protein
VRKPGPLPLDPFLQPCLGIAQGAEPSSFKAAKDPDHHPAGCLEPTVGVDGSEHRLEDVCEDRRLLPSPRPFLAPSESHPVVEPELLRAVGQRPAVDHLGPHLRKGTFVGGFVCRHENFRDEEVEHRIPEKLESLVSERQIPELVRGRLMGEGTLVMLETDEAVAETILDLREGFVPPRVTPCQ